MKKELFMQQLGELVEIPSVTTNTEACHKAIDYIISILPRGVRCERWQASGVETLVVGNHELHTPDVAYVVHADVVKEINPSQFCMAIKGDKLIGRGASDMKFSIPIGVSLLKTVVDEGLNLDFALVVTTDEEVGGKNGVKKMVNDRGFLPKCVIVPDGGDGFKFISKSKGLASIDVTFNGKAAHASEIWSGHSANHDLCLLGAKLTTLYEANNKKNIWATTMNIGIIRGGEVTNQVSPYAEMNLDFRFTEERSAMEILNQVSKLAKEISPDVLVSLLGQISPSFVDMNNPIIQLFLRKFEEVLKRKIEIANGTGANDGRHFNKLGIPVMVMKPDGGGVHGEEEWVSFLGCLYYFDAVLSFLREYKLKPETIVPRGRSRADEHFG